MHGVLFGGRGEARDQGVQVGAAGAGGGVLEVCGAGMQRSVPAGLWGGVEGVHVLVDHEPDVGSLQGGIAGADEGLFGGFWGGLVVFCWSQLGRCHAPAFVRAVPGTVRTLLPTMRSRRAVTSGL